MEFCIGKKTLKKLKLKTETVKKFLNGGVCLGVDTISTQKKLQLNKGLMEIILRIMITTRKTLMFTNHLTGQRANIMRVLMVSN